MEESMNKKIMEAFSLGDMVKAVEEGLCPFCRNPVNFEGFRDDLSRREFKISGLCQKCQDEIFGGGNEE